MKLKNSARFGSGLELWSKVVATYHHEAQGSRCSIFECDSLGVDCNPILVRARSGSVKENFECLIRGSDLVTVVCD